MYADYQPTQLLNWWYTLYTIVNLVNSWQTKGTSMVTVKCKWYNVKGKEIHVKGVSKGYTVRRVQVVPCEILAGSSSGIILCLLLLSVRWASVADVTRLLKKIYRRCPSVNPCRVFGVFFCRFVLFSRVTECAWVCKPSGDISTIVCIDLVYFCLLFLARVNSPTSRGENGFPNIFYLHVVPQKHLNIWICSKTQ